MPDVTLTVTRTWITLPDDPGGDSIVCGSTQSTQANTSLDGELRQYAGGRTQAVVFDADTRQYDYTLRWLSLADREKLRLWRGRTVLVRTMDGVRIWATYVQVQWTRLIGTSSPDGSGAPFSFDAEILFTETSYNEAV